MYKPKVPSESWSSASIRLGCFFKLFNSCNPLRKHLYNTRAYNNVFEKMCSAIKENNLLAKCYMFRIQCGPPWCRNSFPHVLKSCLCAWWGPGHGSRCRDEPHLTHHSRPYKAVIPDWTEECAMLKNSKERPLKSSWEDHKMKRPLIRTMRHQKNKLFHNSSCHLVSMYYMPTSKCFA